jgi:hypothetical protein
MRSPLSPFTKFRIPITPIALTRGLRYKYTLTLTILFPRDDPATTVDFKFTSLTNETTYVVIKNFGFNQTGDDLIEEINTNTGGFTTVLDD